MIPLLQGPLNNRHATLIMLFMNAVEENTTSHDRIADLNRSGPTMERVLKFLPLTQRPTGGFDPYVFKITLARDLVRTYDHIFDR